MIGQRSRRAHEELKMQAGERLLRDCMWRGVAMVVSVYIPRSLSAAAIEANSWGLAQKESHETCDACMTEQLIGCIEYDTW